MSALWVLRPRTRPANSARARLHDLTDVGAGELHRWPKPEQHTRYQSATVTLKNSTGRLIRITASEANVVWGHQTQRQHQSAERS